MKPAPPQSRLQFSLSTLLLVAVTVGIVVGTLADEFRLAEAMRLRVNRYSLAWWDERETMTAEDVHTFLGEPTAESAGSSEEVFRWDGWLLRHELRVTYDGGRPTTTVSLHLPRLGAGSVLLATVAAVWVWRMARRRARAGEKVAGAGD